MDTSKEVIKKIIEYIIKTNCNSDYCIYNDKNCYDYCITKILIKKIGEIYNEKK